MEQSLIRWLGLWDKSWAPGITAHFVSVCQRSLLFPLGTLYIELSFAFHNTLDAVLSYMVMHQKCNVLHLATIMFDRTCQSHRSCCGHALHQPNYSVKASKHRFVLLPGGCFLVSRNQCLATCVRYSVYCKLHIAFGIRNSHHYLMIALNNRICILCQASAFIMGFVRESLAGLVLSFCSGKNELGMRRYLEHEHGEPARFPLLPTR